MYDTGKVTFSVAPHNFNTGIWDSDDENHWNPCMDTGCTAHGNEAAHNKDVTKGEGAATFEADGYTGDKYCSVCDRKMETGKAIAAGKYIRESKASMTPAAITADLCTNDLVFASLEPSKYTVALFTVYDMTDINLNTDSGQYPKDAKFINGHKYRIVFKFTAAGSYVYDEEREGYTSIFTLNGDAAEMVSSASYSGSTSRKIELTAGAGTVTPADEYNITVTNGKATVGSTEVTKAAAGTTVTLTADAPASGKEFDKWIVSGAAVADVNSAATTFTMPAGEVTAEAAYKDAKKPATGGSYTPAVQKPEITIIGSGKADLSTDGRTAAISADEGSELVSVTVNGKEVTIKDGKITGLKTGDKVQVTFKAKAPTKEEQDQNAVKTVKNLKLTVRTSRTPNRNVKVYVKADSSLNAAVAELKAAGYTVKYKFYRSAKKASGYQQMLTKNTKIYVNTMGSKNTCYYYKVRLAVCDADGRMIAQTNLKQCRYGSRVWNR